MSDTETQDSLKRTSKAIDIFSTPEMTPSYKLSYFNITALGEPIRFLLSYGGIEFEDNRVEHDNWSDLKPKMPFGQMPVLEYNGKMAHQSIAIARYLAKQVKLVGKNDWEDLEIDSTVDTINDFRLKIGRFHYESDVSVKASLKEPLYNDTIPYYLKKFEEIALQNGGYLAVNRLTWADIFFVSLLGYLNGMSQIDLLADCHNLQKVKENVLAVPNIKNWVEKRPKTEI